MKTRTIKYKDRLSFLTGLSIFVLGCHSPKGQSGNDDCSVIKSIPHLGIYFNNFSFEDVKMIQIKISSGQKRDIKWESIKVNKQPNDTIRNQLSVYFKKPINLSDTVYLKLSNGKVHSIHSFKYHMRPHASMGQISYSCDFYELYVDNEKQIGGIASIWNKN